MALLVAALAAALAVAALVWAAPAVGEPAGRRWIRRAAVALVAALPLVYASWLLLPARGRLGALSIDYVGEQLALGPDLPVTAGGSDRDSGRAEDLHAARLAGAALTLVPVESGGLTAELGSPAPAVEVDGELRNAVALAAGDVVEIAASGGGPPLELAFASGALSRGERRVELPTGWLLALRGSDRVVFLHDLLAELAPEAAAHPWSFLRYAGGWQLVLREPGVAVRRPSGERATLETRLALPSPMRLRLGVVLGRPGRRSLVWVRDDRLLRHDALLEVRFGRPSRYLAEVEEDRAAAGDAPRRLALVVPGTSDRREMIELDEPSPRFRGLSAQLDVAADGPVEIRFLGATRALALGEVYGLGEGDDLLFLRFGRETFPWPLLLDLALLGLFVAVFLGPSLVHEAGLAAFVAPAGLLLANRLLFAWKAAHRPPAYPLDALAEARLALWLVPALLLAGWTLAWALGRVPAVSHREVRLPLAGLLAAAAGCALVGAGGDRLLALVPLALAGLLLALPALTARPAVAGRLQGWRRDGLPWRPWWLLAAGAVILAGRWLAAALGMPEALRVPGGGRLLLWTVVQIPLCVVLVALALDRVRRRPGPAAVAELLGFLALAFAAVAAVAGDLGLLLVQGLPFAFALLLVASWPRGLALGSRAGAAAALALALAVLPALAVVTVNRWPEAAVRLLGGGAGAAGGEGRGSLPVRDRAAELSAQRAQQLFRLYLLANPAALQEVGLEGADRAAVQYETLQGYATAGGWRGGGFLSAPLPRHLGTTYLSDLVPMVFVLPELGMAGLSGLALLYLLPLGWLAAARPVAPPAAAQGTLLAVVAALAFAVPGLYMILANLDLVLFSGKNTPLLGLNSLSDAVETGLVLALAAVGLAVRRSGR